MDVREKLVELLADAGLGKTERYFLADCLIANGVTVQEWIPASPVSPMKNGNGSVKAIKQLLGRIM